MLRVTAQLIRSVASADIVASCRICIIDRRSVFLCACILWNREICDTVIERKRIGARLLKAELREGFSYINFIDGLVLTLTGLLSISKMLVSST